ncbi:MAG: 30S ribosomal protein S17 [Chloroflexi bacterium]|nr:30S ribosomal protein S17 [Chloroflexota bacterium]MCI0780890.1 30S ribosomal protein S17 [Chloroflexota bacterium]
MAKSMRKVRTGSVVGSKMDKTAVVEMVWKQRNRLYRKQVRRVARFKVHDPLNQCQLGDVVRIEETRPISKTKHWRLMEILERRQVAEVRPIELESDAETAPEVLEPLATSEEPEEADEEELSESEEPEEDQPADEPEDGNAGEEETEA